MKKAGIITAVFGALLITGCTTDFELEAEWKDIPVVYGFISIQDTAHYIRLEKVFLEPGGNATQIAQIADSIYYDEDVTVELEKINTGETYVLQRVDGNLEGYPKEEGAFANAPNYLYKVNASLVELEGGEPVRLSINRGDALPVVTAETRVVSPIDSLASQPSTNIRRLRYNQDLNIGWRAETDATIFDIRFIIYYLESQPAAPSEFELKSLEWPVNQAFLRSNDDRALSTSTTGEAFYRFIANNVPRSTGEIRIFDSMELIITGAGQELEEFIRVARANTGITSSQEVPTFSNVTEGLGVFTSRYSLFRPGIKLTSEARDSLINGIYTKDLNFR